MALTSITFHTKWRHLSLGLLDRSGPTSSHSSDESGLEVDAFADRRPRAPQTIQIQTNGCRVKRRLTSTRLTQRERTDRPGTTTGGGPRNSGRDHGSATVPLHSTLGIQEDSDPQGTLRAECGMGSPYCRNSNRNPTHLGILEKGIMELSMDYFQGFGASSKTESKPVFMRIFIEVHSAANFFCPGGYKLDKGLRRSREFHAYCNLEQESDRSTRQEARNELNHVDWNSDASSGVEASATTEESPRPELGSVLKPPFPPCIAHPLSVSACTRNTAAEDLLRAHDRGAQLKHDQYGCKRGRSSHSARVKAPSWGRVTGQNTPGESAVSSSRGIESVGSRSVENFRVNSSSQRVASTLGIVELNTAFFPRYFNARASRNNIEQLAKSGDEPSNEPNNKNYER
ncbi:hypothetical protein C8J57DRAFT_1239105 [Mycena rebaudengoi]|nr:hypothetical protein C8J57DRAFT_1239105 [Mycena rebaudengoi]